MWRNYVEVAICLNILLGKNKMDKVNKIIKIKLVDRVLFTTKHHLKNLHYLDRLQHWTEPA